MLCWEALGLPAYGIKWLGHSLTQPSSGWLGLGVANQQKKDYVRCLNSIIIQHSNFQNPNCVVLKKGRVSPILQFLTIIWNLNSKHCLGMSPITGLRIMATAPGPGAYVALVNKKYSEINK